MMSVAESGIIGLAVEWAVPFTRNPYPSYSNPDEGGPQRRKQRWWADGTREMGASLAEHVEIGSPNRYVRTSPDPVVALLIGEDKGDIKTY